MDFVQLPANVTRLPYQVSEIEKILQLYFHLDSMAKVLLSP